MVMFVHNGFSTPGTTDSSPMSTDVKSVFVIFGIPSQRHDRRHPGETHFDIHAWRTGVRRDSQTYLCTVLDGSGGKELHLEKPKDLFAFTGYVVPKITVDASGARCVNFHHLAPPTS